MHPPQKNDDATVLAVWIRSMELSIVGGFSPVFIRCPHQTASIPFCDLFIQRCFLHSSSFNHRRFSVIPTKLCCPRSLRAFSGAVIFFFKHWSYPVTLKPSIQCTTHPILWCPILCSIGLIRCMRFACNFGLFGSWPERAMPQVSHIMVFFFAAISFATTTTACCTFLAPYPTRHRLIFLPKFATSVAEGLAW